MGRTVGWVFPVMLLAGVLAVVLLYVIDTDRPALPNTPQADRAVVIGPNIVDTLLALDLRDRITAVDVYSVRNGFAPAGTPTVGGIADPDLEGIAALAPSVILTQGRMPDLAALGERLHIPVHDLAMNDLPSILAGLRTLGRMFGIEPAVEAHCQAIRDSLADTSSAIGMRDRPRVLLVTGRMAGDLASLQSTGPGTFLDEAIQAAGGTNYLADSLAAWPSVDVASLYADPPDVIIELRAEPGFTQESARRLLADWSALPPLAPVANDRVFVVNHARTLSPGPFVHDLVRLLAHCCHPRVIAAIGVLDDAGRPRIGPSVPAISGAFAGGP